MNPVHPSCAFLAARLLLREAVPLSLRSPAGALPFSTCKNCLALLLFRPTAALLGWMPHIDNACVTVTTHSVGSALNSNKDSFFKTQAFRDILSGSRCEYFISVSLTCLIPGLDGALVIPLPAEPWHGAPSLLAQTTSLLNWHGAQD